MAGKRTRQSRASKGERSNLSKDVRKLQRKAYLESNTQMLNKQAAFRKGKRVMVTIPNPDASETNKRFIRVPAKEVWKPLK